MVIISAVRVLLQELSRVTEAVPRLLKEDFMELEMRIGIRLAVATLVIAALCAPIAEGAAEVPEKCRTLVTTVVCATIANGAAEVPEECRSRAERYTRAPEQGTLETLAGLESCLAGRSDSPQPTASASAPAGQMPVEPRVRQPTRARGEWPAAEPWVHTSESWPEKPW